MVTLRLHLLWAESPWSQLPSTDRARLTMALLGFVLLLLGVLAVVLLIGRMVKREVRKPLPIVRDLRDAWAEKPLDGAKKPAVRSSPPEDTSSE